MLRGLAIGAVLVGAIGASTPSHQPQTSGDVPKEIAVPDGYTLLVALHGRGVQSYKAT